MNKQLTILTLVAILILAVVGVIIHERNQYRFDVQTKSLAIGQSLIQETNSTFLIEIGANLKSKLGEFLGSPARVECVSLGDEAAPIGDGSASSQLWLINERHERVTIRLRRDNESGKFQVLGFWTPLDAPKESNR